MGALRSKHCSKGHKFTPENTYIRSNGQRECRKCSLRRGLARRVAQRLKRIKLKRGKQCPGNTYEIPIPQ
jgi:hypothetical protein